MKKLLFTLAMAVSLFSNEYKVDKDYSSIKFEASKMLFVGVSGEFLEFSGTIKLDENKKLSQIDGLVSVDSINTEDEERDGHLKADDYFYTAKFPNIIFKSNEINENIVKAVVSIKGIKKELEFKISEFSMTNNSVNFKLVSTVDRQKFLLNGSMSGIISDNVDVIANINAIK